MRLTPLSAGQLLLAAALAIAAVMWFELVKLGGKDCGQKEKNANMHKRGEKCGRDRVKYRVERIGLAL